MSKIKRAGGRPIKFKAEYIEQVYRLALLGLTDNQMASFFEVSEVTFNSWKKKYPKFFKSLKDGKLPADSNAANSLYKKTQGFHYIEEFQDKDGNISYSKKFHPPDTTAIAIWLNNRQPDLWRQKREVIEGGTEETGDINIKIEIEDARKED